MISITVNSVQLNPYFVNLSITRELDGICSFSFDYPLSDSLSSNLAELLRVDFYVDSVNIFSGRINNIQDKVSNSTILRSVSGVGLLDDLRKKLIPPNILHYNELLTNSFNPSFANTVILDNTWSVVTEDLSESVTYLTSLQSSLSAISTFCELAGFHYRYTSGKNLEIYKSLVSSGVTIQNTSNQGNFEIDNQTLIIDGEITTSTDSKGIYNYVYAVGGTSDNGMNQITLRDVRSSTINSSYPITQSPIVPNTDASYTASVYTNIESAPNTTVAFVVSSPSSIAKYGQIEKAIAKKDVHVTSSDKTTFSNINRQDAADQLYKSIVEQIKLNEEPTQSISLSAFGDFINLKVGQTVKLSSNKTIATSGDQSGSGEVFNYSQDFILTKYTLKFEENKTFRYQLELSNIPKVQKGDVQILTETIQSVNDYERQRKGSVTTYPQYFKDSFDSLNPLKGLLWIPEDFVYVDKLKLKIKIQAFRSYSTGVTSSATTATTSSTVTTTTSSTQVAVTGTTSSDATGSHTHTVNSLNHSHKMFASAGLGSFNSITAAAGTLPANSWTVYDDAGLTGVKFVGNFSATTIGTIATSDSGTGTVPTSASNGTHSHDIPSQNINIPGQTLNLTIPGQTITIPAQTVSLQYGIFEDTANPPTGLKLYIDGVDYSGQISIPNGFGETPNTNDSTIDLLVAIHNLGQFQSVFTPGIHEIELRCGSGRALGEMHIFGQFYLESK